MKQTISKTTIAAIGGVLCIVALVSCFLVMAGSGKQADIADGSLRIDGSKLTVELNSNASTGYAWFSDATGNATVTADQRYEEGDNVDGSGETMVGVPGRTVFTYVGIEEGATEFTLSYKRAWEDSNADKTLTFTVNTDQNGKIKSIQGTDTNSAAIKL